MPIIIFIIAIFIIISASKSNKNTNNGPTNYNTGNPNPYRNPANQGMPQNPANMQNNPYSAPNRQVTQPNPYSVPNRQDLNQLKERLYSKYGAQIQNKNVTQANPQTASNRMPQPQQRPVNNAVPKRENIRQTVGQSQQQPNVGLNQDKAKKAENISAMQDENTGINYADSAVTPLSALVPQNFLSLGATNTLVLTETPSSLMMGISDYDFSFWGIGTDKS